MLHVHVVLLLFWVSMATAMLPRMSPPVAIYSYVPECPLKTRTVEARDYNSWVGLGSG